jgi:outer membrane receptor protein involved in Fe transport
MWTTLVALARAQAVNPFEEADEGELFRFEEELVTVASRYAQTLRKAPSIVTLITADEIRERQYRKLSEVLRTLPGVYVWRSEEGRDLAAFRGVVSADNNKLLVLVDGVPWYEGVYTHGFIDEFLPLANVARIEVIKGPGSAIYGTNAFTGVVNIVTFSAAELDGARVRVTGGTGTRGEATATAGGRTAIGTIPTSATAYVRLFGQTGEGLDVTPKGRIDVASTDPRKSVNAGVEVQFGDLTLQVLQVDFAHTFLFNETDTPFEALGKSIDTFDLQYHDTFADARWRLGLGESTVTPYAWYQRHDNPGAYFFGGDVTVDPVTLEASQFFMTVDAEKRTDRIGGGVDAELRPALDHVVVTGVGVETVRVLRLFDLGFPAGGDPFVLNDFAVTDACGQPAGLYTNPERCAAPTLRNLFGYAQYTWTAAPFLELTAGARVDSRLATRIGPTRLPSRGAVSPRIGVLLVPTDALTAKLLYGRAFRAPSVRELLVTVEPDPATGDYPFASGNPALAPETIDTAEAEVVASPVEGLELRADGSYSVLSNEIDKVAPPGFYCNLPGDLRVVGGEVGARLRTGRLDLSADYALTLARYGDDAAFDPAICDFRWQSPYAGRSQYEFPPHMGKGAVAFEVSPQLHLTAFAEVYGVRPRAEWSPNAANPDGEPVALLHVSGRMPGLGPDGRVEVGFGVRNLLDARWSTGVYRDDADEEGRPTPVSGEGRSVTVSVEVAL